MDRDNVDISRCIRASLMLKASDTQNMEVHDAQRTDHDEVESISPASRPEVGGGCRRRKAKPKTATSRKERRRTQNINAAFDDLRKHIPNVPSDTKLSKIKTLKLAMSYIHHLENQLEDETRDQEIVTPTKESSRETDSNNNATDDNNCTSNDQVESPKVNTTLSHLYILGV